MPETGSDDSRLPAVSQEIRPHLRLIVGIATSGRPAVLKSALASLRQQSRPPDFIYVAFVEESDLLDARAFSDVCFLQAPKGICVQRNHILGHAGRSGVILYVDDDFVLHPDYLQHMEAAFLEDPSLVAATGTVLADGAQGRGLRFEEAESILGQTRIEAQYLRSALTPVFNTYGCNMAFRLSTIAAHNIRFDESLPMYGWYEDIDFSRRLLPFGTVARVPDACGVHMGVKSGRTSGRRFGYSQVANPLYLAHKGSYPWSHALRSIARHVAINLARGLVPEPYIDRRERIRGNWTALRDLIRGELHPTRILEL